MTATTAAAAAPPAAARPRPAPAAAEGPPHERRLRLGDRRPRADGSRRSRLADRLDPLRGRADRPCPPRRARALGARRAGGPPRGAAAQRHRGLRRVRADPGARLRRRRPARRPAAPRRGRAGRARARARADRAPPDAVGGARAPGGGDRDARSLGPMSFASPILLAGLLLIPLLAYAYVRWERRPQAFAPRALLPSVAPRRAGWRRHVAV